MDRPLIHAAAKLEWGCQQQEYPMPRKSTSLEAVATTGIDRNKNMFHPADLPISS
jgi:hypothetical protein